MTKLEKQMKKALDNLFFPKAKVKPNTSFKFIILDMTDGNKTNK